MQGRNQPLRNRNRLRSVSEFQGPRVLSGCRLWYWHKTMLARAAMMEQAGLDGHVHAETGDSGSQRTSQ